MIIDKSKTYRTRDGRPVRIYATDGAKDRTLGKESPVHGAIFDSGEWYLATWGEDGATSLLDRPDDLIEADPHGILPRHRELLAAEFEACSSEFAFVPQGWADAARTRSLDEMMAPIRAALIALAKLDAEKAK